MPEFAEVNHQVQWLRARVEGATIARFSYRGGHFTALKDAPQKDAVLKGFFEGATLHRVMQRGKHVVMHLSTGTLVSHQMFQGRWSLDGDDFISRYKHHREPVDPKSVSFSMETSKGRVVFSDPEYKARVHAHPGVESADVPSLRELGPDVLVTPESDPAFAQPWDADTLTRDAARTRTAVKALLLDQKKQAGIGNMYACEALYRAEIAPARPSNSLSASECARLVDAVQSVIASAIGTGLDYDRVLSVYRRDTDPQGDPVEVTEIGGRDTYWVPTRQR